MVEHRRRLVRALGHQESLKHVVGGNGGGVRPQAFAEVQTEIETETAEITRCLEAIHDLGGHVKDLDRGLVDFPAFREGREVLLCWQLGEDEVCHWHELDEGYGGRQSL